MTAIIITGIIVIAVLLLEIWRELHTFNMTRYTVSSPKLARMQGNKKIVFLSDMHNKTYGDPDSSRLVQAIRKEQPDLVLIGGDMMVGKKGHDCEPALRFVKQLASVCPVYYANGNHEQRAMDRPEYYGTDIERYREELREAGVHFLENEYVQISLDGTRLCIFGLEIPERCYGRFHQPPLGAEEIRQRIGQCPLNSYNILLAHNPGYTDVYRAWGADLTLSGHYHGGIVGIPGLGGVVAPGFFLFPKYSGGKYDEEGTTTVVSRGLGSHTIPLRLFNPAEVVVIELASGQ